MKPFDISNLVANNQFHRHGYGLYFVSPASMMVKLEVELDDSGVILPCYSGAAIRTEFNKFKVITAPASGTLYIFDTPNESIERREIERTYVPTIQEDTIPPAPGQLLKLFAKDSIILSFTAQHLSKSAADQPLMAIITLTANPRLLAAATNKLTVGIKPEYVSIGAQQEEISGAVIIHLVNMMFPLKVFAGETFWYTANDFAGSTFTDSFQSALVYVEAV